MIRPSENLINHIKKHEGFEPKAYRDVTGRKTIGYGDTMADMNQPLDEGSADKLLRERLNQFAEEISPFVKRNNLSEHQQDVILDMAYNLGTPTVAQSTFMKLVNAGDDESAAKEILKYTKAVDEKTGRRKDFPGLVNRAKDRFNLWTQALNMAQSGVNLEDILAEVDQELGANASGDSLEQILDEVDQEISEPTELLDSVTARQGALDSTSFAGPEDLETYQKISDLAEKEGISFEEASLALADNDEKSAAMEMKKNTIASRFPETAKFASVPENYQLVKTQPELFTRLESSLQPLKKKFTQAYDLAVKSNQTLITSPAVHLGMLFGATSREEGIRSLRQMEMESRSVNIEDLTEGFQKIQKETEVLKGKFLNEFNQISAIWDDLTSDFDNTGSEILKLAKESVDAGAAALNFAKVYIDNPVEALAMGAQSAGTFVAPVAGRAIGFLMPVPGSANLGAFVGGAYVNFGAYMQEQLEEFRDPSTGLIDYERAYSDPERVSGWRKEAFTYASVMGLFDTATAGKVGDFVAKPMRKVFARGTGKTAVGKAFNVAKGLVAETAVQQGAEGLSEVTARVAAAKAGGKEITPSLAADIGVEATLEALTPNPAIAVTATISGAVKASTTFKERVKSGSKVNQESNESISKFNTSQKIREDIESSEITGKHPQQTKEFVNNALTEDQPPVEFSDDFDTDPSNEALDVEVKRIEDIADSGSVRISPSEFKAFFEGKEIDDVEFINQFGNDVAFQYQNAIETDSSITIDAGDWYRFTKDWAGIDAIARFTGSQYNAVEGDYANTEINNNADKLFSKDGEVEATAEATEPETVVEVDAPEDVMEEPILRPINLFGRFKDEENKKVYDTIRRQLTKAAGEEIGSSDFIDAVAEIQYRHLKGRAELTGVGISELSKRLKIKGRKQTSSEERDGIAGFLQEKYSIDSIKEIVLMRGKANKTVVLHELGHAWLSAMAEDYDYISRLNPETMTEKQLEYKFAMDEVASMLALDNVGLLAYGAPNMSNAERKRAHETFAQTAERYFYEGKFENNRIKHIMARFRSWLSGFVNILGMGYKSQGIPYLEINPRVERVFETILDISKKVEDEVYPMYPKPQFTREVLGKDYDSYIKSVYDARDEAIAEAYAKAHKKPLNEREKLIDEALNSIYDEASQEVEQLESMKILSMFERDYTRFKNGDTDTDNRINYESVVKKLFGGDERLAAEFKAAVPNVMMTGKKKGTGIDVGLALNMLNKSPEQLVSLMREAGRKDQIIEQRANELIKKKFPAIKTDEEIHDIAVEAVNGGGKRKLINKELKILAEKHLGTLRKLNEKAALPPMMINKMAKESINDKADKMVLNASIYKFSPKTFLTDANRHGRRAAAFIRKGDYESAFEYKYLEALHFNAYLKAQNAVKEAAKTKLSVNRLAKLLKNSSSRKKYDIGVLKYAQVIVRMMQQGDNNFPPFTPDNYSSKFIPPSSVETINTTIKEYVDSTEGRKGLNTSIKSYIYFGKVVGSLIKVSKDAMTVKFGEQEMLLDAAGDMTLAEIGGKKKGDKELDVDDNLSNALTNARNLRSTFISLFPNDIEANKSLLMKVFDIAAQAEAVRGEDFDAVVDKINGAFLKVSGKNSGIRGIVDPIVKRIPLLSAKDSFSNPVSMKRLGANFKNKAQLLKAALIAGSESGLEILMRGGFNNSGPLVKLDAEGNANFMAFWDDFKDLIDQGVVTVEDIEFLNTVWDAFEESYPDIKRVAREVDNIDVGYVKGMTISTKLGDIKGRYYPVRSAARDIKKMENTLLDPDNDYMPMAELFPHMNSSQVKARTGAAYDVDLDLSRLTSDLASVMNYKHLRSPMLQIGKYFQNEKVKSALEARRPGIYEKVLIPWYNRVKTQEYSARPDSKTEGSYEGSINQFFGVLRRNTQIAMYAANVGFMVRQFIGIVPTVKTIGVKYVAPAAIKGALNAPRTIGSEITKGAERGLEFIGARSLSRAVNKLSIEPTASRKMVIEKSPRMKERFEKHVKNMVRSFEQMDLNNDWVSKSQDASRRLAFFFGQATQKMIDEVTWLAAYEKALENNLTETQAISFADNAVERTQTSSAITSMSNLQFGSELKKLLTQIQSVPISMNNLIFERVDREPTTLAKYRAFTGMVIALGIMPAILNQLVNESLDWKDDAEEDEEKRKEKYWKDLQLQMASETASIILPPMSSFFAPTAMALFDIESRPYGNPTLDMISKSPIGAKGLRRSLQGVEMTPYEFQQLMIAFTLATGISFSSIGRMFRAFDDLFTTEDERSDRNAERREQLQLLKDSENE